MPMNLTAANPARSIIFFSAILVTVYLLTTPYYLYALLPGPIIIGMLLLGHFPHIGYYLIIFLIPFGAFRGLSTAYPFLKLHWLIGAWIIIIVSFKFLFDRKKPVELTSNLWPWIAVFSAVNLIAAFVSQYQITSFNDIRLLIVGYVLFFALSLVFISRSVFCSKLPVILISSVSLGSLLALVGYFLDIPFFTIGPDAFKRAIGAATDPNNLSLMVVFIIPLLFYWLFSSPNPVVKWLSSALIILNIMVVILTYSRGGAVVLAITLVLIAIHYLNRFRPKYSGFVMIVIALGIVLTAIYVPSSYWSRIGDITEARDTAIGKRVSYLHVGWDAFKEHPLIGSGPGTFRDFYAETHYSRHFAREKGDPLFRRYAHNTYLEVLVGSGILGLTSFLLILLLTFKNFHAAKRNFQLSRNERMSSLVSAYQLSFISLITYLFLYSNTYNKFLLISLALSSAALKFSQESAE
jgi:O-antigen ligase